MRSQTDHGTRLLNQLDPLIMLGAIVILFVALGTESWWTLNGATVGSLFNIQISPFYLHIEATGLPSTVPLANGLGSFTRTFLLLGFLTLFAASIRPTSWWRNLAIYFGLASIVELYLSFTLMYYWFETAFVSTFGVPPPYYGTTALQANVIGLDLSYYTAPQVTATFNVPCYLGFLSTALLLGRSFIKTLHDRAFQALASLLPGGGIHDVYLTPPFQQVWFSSGNKEFNPMQQNPDELDDAQLLASFQKLYETVEPGGSLSIILPDWATKQSDRLEKLIPEIGFTLEKAGTIYRTQEKPENELRFRKPLAASSARASEAVPEPAPESTPAFEPAAPPQIQETSTEQGPLLTSPPPSIPSQIPLALAPVPETVEAPTWQNTRLTRLERSILKSALRTITNRKQPVPYRELLNQVYMDLVDHKIEFDSARQIETTLVNRNGRELVLVEETDESGSHNMKKWWLGDQKMSSEKRGLPELDRIKAIGPKFSGIARVFRKTRASRHRQTREDDESVEESACH